MKKLLNVLYITRPDAYISKDGLNIIVTVDKEELIRIPILNLEGIVTFGYLGASPGAMKLCVDNNVSLSFLTPAGRFIARIQGPTRGNVHLRKRQYFYSENIEFSLSLSKIFIAGKILNSRNILCRALRDNGDNVSINDAVQNLSIEKKKALSAETPESLRGIEGHAASTYFSVFSNLILQQKDTFKFSGRNRRPPKDEVNILLSFVYTLIANEVAAALESVGLDPYVGFFHKLRPGRSSLALDLMEELRAYLGDRFVLSLINRHQIKSSDFNRQTNETIQLTDNGRKTIIKAWQERKKKELMHPYLNEKISIGLLPYVQAMLLARYIRGDIDNYPVYIIK